MKSTQRATSMISKNFHDHISLISCYLVLNCSRFSEEMGLINFFFPKRNLRIFSKKIPDSKLYLVNRVNRYTWFLVNWLKIYKLILSSIVREFYQNVFLETVFHKSASNFNINNLVKFDLNDFSPNSLLWIISKIWGKIMWNWMIFGSFILSYISSPTGQDISLRPEPWRGPDSWHNIRKHGINFIYFIIPNVKFHI